MLFKPKNKNICDTSISIFVGDHEIHRVNYTKFLGVQIDANLTWKEHVNEICQKISRSIGVINRLKQTIPRKILLTLYNTMILPYISYCNIIWGNCAIYLSNRILILQKRATRIINNAQPLTHTDPLFKKFKILKVNDINRLQVAVCMYSCFNNLLPQTFNDLFIYNCAIHSHSTRTSQNIHLPLYKYNFSHTTISFSGGNVGMKCHKNVRNLDLLISLDTNTKIIF